MSENEAWIKKNQELKQTENMVSSGKLKVS